MLNKIGIGIAVSSEEGTDTETLSSIYRQTESGERVSNGTFAGHLQAYRISKGTAQRVCASRRVMVYVYVYLVSPQPRH